MVVLPSVPVIPATVRAGWVRVERRGQRAERGPGVLDHHHRHGRGERRIESTLGDDGDRIPGHGCGRVAMTILATPCHRDEERAGAGLAEVVGDRADLDVRLAARESDDPGRTEEFAQANHVASLGRSRAAPARAWAESRLDWSGIGYHPDMRSSRDLLDDARRVIPEVTPQQVAREKGSRTLIDVRERDEFEAGYIPGSVHLSKGFIEVQIEDKVPARTARSPSIARGTRSLLAARALHELGYSDVRSMSGGFNGWKQAGFDFESPTS